VNLADIAFTSWRQHPWSPLQRADDVLPTDMQHANASRAVSKSSCQARCKVVVNPLHARRQPAVRNLQLAPCMLALAAPGETQSP